MVPGNGVCKNRSKQIAFAFFKDLLRTICRVIDADVCAVQSALEIIAVLAEVMQKPDQVGAFFERGDSKTLCFFRGAEQVGLDGLPLPALARMSVVGHNFPLLVYSGVPVEEAFTCPVVLWYHAKFALSRQIFDFLYRFRYIKCALE